MIPGLSAGSGSSLDFTGGAAQGGNQKNYWGDNTGSQIIMGSNSKTQNLILSGIVGAIIGGVAVWIRMKK